ncbi:class I adenylate-forming enzyme family protein [Aeromicrobium wangtongii]|uniref:AMP-binding protein n=1 Tax=Aeromicrobium wangtongii TaxID=2969247 RepID=A0ABY5MH07_9ACTN|nr:AMP-binding protein [Aeromicrobium wangtongii]MCD9197676.1 AMP-binding protein [Aeromicrobium wangtongii]UUP15161.1 AMP-binding protein [Aeromicrobium wangtongii]
MDVRGLMRQSAVFNSRRPAIVHGDVRLTYAEAWERGLRMANGLLALGLQPGDRVGVLEDNSIGAQDMFAGAGAAGLVRVPLYARNSVESHKYMLEHTGCRAVVVEEHYRDDIEAIRDELPELEHVLVRDHTYEQWLKSQSRIDPDVPIDPDDTYIIRHSGGTTGRPKGVAYTHRSWLAAGRDWFYNFPPMQAGDPCLHMGPISHGSGYLYTPTWLSGGVNILLDQFDPDAVIDVMATERVSYMFCVPAMLNALTRLPAAREHDWAALKVIQLGGAPVTDKTALLAREIFGPTLYQGYGQTEALPVCMMGPQEWFSDVEGSSPLRSAGRALPFAYLQIRDPDNSSVVLDIGSEGEIAIRCDGQMLGFWNNPDATAERMTQDQFVLTGDIGKLDQNGYLYVLDRKDDMIISGGFNIWPAELENVIQGHPAVVEVAVVSVPHVRWGESSLALCVIEEGAAVSEQDIIDLCADQLGSYKKPSAVQFRTTPLPKSPVGKVQRKVLREPFWEGHERRVSGN